MAIFNSYVSLPEGNHGRLNQSAWRHRSVAERNNDCGSPVTGLEDCWAMRKLPGLVNIQKAIFIVVNSGE